MIIGFDAKRYFANFTGLGNYSRTLVENLVKYHPENRYQLYTFKAPAQRDSFPLSEPCVSIHTPGSLPGRLSGSLWRSYLIRSDLVLGPPDIYHGLSHEIPVGIGKSIKTVVTIHDLIFLRHPEFYRAAERMIYVRKFRHACRRADRIVAVSEQTRRDVIEFFGIPADRIETIYQSCDPVFSLAVEDSARRAVRAKYRLPDNYILYVGSFNKRKNLIGLVEALSLMKNALDVHLVLVGDGRQVKEQLRERVRQLNLEKRVFIRSGIPNADLPAVYQSARLFVYPSFYEGFGIPIIEAMSGRVPVVTSRNGCFPEAGGPDSLYVDPEKPAELAAAMERVLTDSRLAARMIEKGAAYVKRFDGRKTSAHLVRLYRELVE